MFGVKSAVACDQSVGGTICGGAVFRKSCKIDSGLTGPAEQSCFAGSVFDLQKKMKSCVLTGKMKSVWPKGLFQ